MAPVAPYCTSAQVALLNLSVFKGKDDFDEYTTPTKTRVDSLISIISSHVDSNLNAAGYYVPLQEISGETWPDFQTNYLTLVTTVGVAAKVFFEQLAPAPSLTRAGGRLGNLFDEQYALEMRKIYDYQNDSTRLRFRARFRQNTPAQQLMQMPRGPQTDYSRGYYDPARSWNFEDFTELADRIQSAFRELNVPWDYMYELLNTGLGPTMQETEIW